MDDEAVLRDKLRKIEALFAGAATAGEKAAAGAAANRIRARLRQEEKRQKPVEMRFSLPDPWSRQMFIALCRRYGLRPLIGKCPGRPVEYCAGSVQRHGAGRSDRRPAA